MRRISFIFTLTSLNNVAILIFTLELWTFLTFFGPRKILSRDVFEFAPGGNFLQELVFVFVSEFLSKTFVKNYLFSEIIFLPWISTFFREYLKNAFQNSLKMISKNFKNYFQQQSLKIIFWKN